MTRVAFCVALVAIALPSGASRAAAQTWAEGWEVVRLPISSPRGFACTADRVVVRDWPGSVVVWNGTSTELFSAPDQGYGESVWAAENGEVFLTAGASVAHRTPTGWELLRVSGLEGWMELHGLWGTGPSDVYIALLGAIALRRGDHFERFDAGTWRDQRAVGGSGPRDVWMVGEGGLARRHDGTRWTEYATGLQAELAGVRAFSPSDVWVWSSSEITHFDGSTWTRRDTVVGGATLGALSSIGGASSERVYATSGIGLSRWNGAAWEPLLRTPDGVDGDESASLIGVCETARGVVAIDSWRSRLFVRPR